MSRRLWPRITDEFTANRLCPDAIARLYLGAPSTGSTRSSGVILFSLADHQFAPAQPGPTPPLIPPLSTRAPLSSPLTRRSRDNSLVKRADDASLFYRGLFPRLEIAFRAPPELCLVRQRKPTRWNDSFGETTCLGNLKRGSSSPFFSFPHGEKCF